MLKGVYCCGIRRKVKERSNVAPLLGVRNEAYHDCLKVDSFSSMFGRHAHGLECLLGIGWWLISMAL